MVYEKTTAEQAGLTNYSPYCAHFQPLDFFCKKEGKKKTIYAFPGGHGDSGYYIQCDSPEYMNGWLYGAVQAACGQHRPLNPVENTAAMLGGKALALPDSMRIDFWMYDEYADQDYSLAFVRLPDLQENPKRILDILRWFEDMYGNTFQNTSVWALEYELLARMLIHNRSLLFNPLHLNLPEVEDELLQMLNTEHRYLYKKARAVSQDKIQRLYKENKGDYTMVKI